MAAAFPDETRRALRRAVGTTTGKLVLKVAVL